MPLGGALSCSSLMSNAPRYRSPAISGLTNRCRSWARLSNRFTTLGFAFQWIPIDRVEAPGPAVCTTAARFFFKGAHRIVWIVAGQIVTFFGGVVTAALSGVDMIALIAP